MPAKKGTKEEKFEDIVFICRVSTDLQVRTAICKFGSGTVTCWITVLKDSYNLQSIGDQNIVSANFMIL